MTTRGGAIVPPISMYQVVIDFEKSIANYAGSKYACVVNSCTNALLLACAYHHRNNPKFKFLYTITMPKRSYIGVPLSIHHAGFKVEFEDIDWQHTGQYQLKPLPVWDSARLCTSNMHKEGQFECISLHWGKTFNLGQGGVILHDDPQAQEYFERARFDGRTPGVAPKDDKPIIGWHCYISPRDAADALTRLHFLPKNNPPLPPEPNYPDLSESFEGVL